MKRFVFVAGVLALVIAATLAPKAESVQVKPPAAPIRPVQPGGAVPAQPLPKAAANRIAAAEEELETLEAQRDVRKAYIKAAEVAVEMVRMNALRLERQMSAGFILKEELDKARLEVEVAKAQLEIRIAELKEVEVKIKYAKKRLEDAKAGIRQPPPAKLVDPPPAR